MQAGSQDEDRAGRLRRWLRRELPPLALTIALLVLARSSFANHYQVPSGSMMRRLVPGGRVVVDLAASGLRVPFTAIGRLARGRPAPGEVVASKSPVERSRLIQRGGGVGGQTCALAAGRWRLAGC